MVKLQGMVPHTFSIHLAALYLIFYIRAKDAIITTTLQPNLTPLGRDSSLQTL